MLTWLHLAFKQQGCHYLSIANQTLLVKVAPSNSKHSTQNNYRREKDDWLEYINNDVAVTGVCRIDIFNYFDQLHKNQVSSVLLNLYIYSFLLLN